MHEYVQDPSRDQVSFLFNMLHLIFVSTVADWLTIMDTSSMEGGRYTVT